MGKSTSKIQLIELKSSNENKKAPITASSITSIRLTSTRNSISTTTLTTRSQIVWNFTKIILTKSSQQRTFSKNNKEFLAISPFTMSNHFLNSTKKNKETFKNETVLLISLKKENPDNFDFNIEGKYNFYIIFIN